MSDKQINDIVVAKAQVILREKGFDGVAAEDIHAQDQEGFKTGKLHVKFGIVINDEKDKANPLFNNSLTLQEDAEMAVGHTIAEVAKAEGLRVEWNGSAQMTVILHYVG